MNPHHIRVKVLFVFEDDEEEEGRGFNANSGLILVLFFHSSCNSLLLEVGHLNMGEFSQFSSFELEEDKDEYLFKKHIADLISQVF